MLHRDPSKRPSVKKILEKEFLADKITSLLSNTVAKHEFRSMGIQRDRELPSIDKDDKVSHSMVASTNKSSDKNLVKQPERPHSVNSNRNSVPLSPNHMVSDKSRDNVNSIRTNSSAKKEDENQPDLDKIEKKNIVHPDKA